MVFKVNPEKNIKKLPQILLNDEFDNYAKTVGKNYNNIENILASKSLSEFRSNHNSNDHFTHQANNNHNYQTNLKSSPNNSNSSTSLDSNSLNPTMKTKINKEKSFYIDDVEHQSPLNHANIQVLELEVKNISKILNYAELI